jgi:glycerol-3-phosphate acyltransferase PlsY
MAAVVFMISQIIMMALNKSFNAVEIVCVLILGILLILRHRENIVRLINGTENKLGAKKDK